MIVVACAAFALPAHAGISRPGGCVAVSVRGFESNRATGMRLVRTIQGFAQGFVASDTLINAITVWLPASAVSMTGSLHLSVVRADDNGRPIPESVIADGGKADLATSGSPPAAQVVYSFDPPAMLPSAGRYAVVLATDSCRVVPVLVDDDDEYAEGELWEVSARQCGGPITSVGAHLVYSDLSFRIEFCDGGTATTGHTWGELKTAYR